MTTLSTGQQAERVIDAARLIGVSQAAIIDLLIHVEDIDTPRPTALAGRLHPSHDGQVYRYVMGDLGSLIIPSPDERTLFDGLTPDQKVA